MRCSSSVQNVLVAAENWRAPGRASRAARAAGRCGSRTRWRRSPGGPAGRTSARGRTSSYSRRLETSRSMPPRSCSICRITWRNEPFRSPTRLAAGTRTSSKNTSQKWRLPVMSRIGLTVRRGSACRPRARTGPRGAGRRGRCGDEVAPVGRGGAGGPDLLAVDHPLVAVALGPGADAGHVRAGVGLAHADAPHRRAGDDPGQPAGPLLVGAELQQARAHLPVGEPGGGDRGADADQGLEHHEPLEHERPPAAVLDRPGHAQPAAGAQLLGEGPVVAGDPGVLGDLGPLGGRQAHLEGLVAQGQQVGGERELHGGDGSQRTGDGSIRPVRCSVDDSLQVRTARPEEYAALGELTVEAYAAADPAVMHGAADELPRGGPGGAHVLAGSTRRAARCWAG